MTRLRGLWMQRIGFLVLLILASGFGAAAQAPNTITKPARSAANPSGAPKAVDLPLFFEANKGQTDPRVKFLTRSSGYTLFLTPTETVLAESKTQMGESGGWGGGTPEMKTTAGSFVRMQLMGANPSPAMTGLEKLPGKVNYLIGRNAAQWQTGVSLFSKVRTEQVYPGVDLLFHGDDRHLEYDFIVAPGADPSKIAFQIRDAARIEIDAHGDLVLHTADSDFRMHKPVIYQTIGTKRRLIEGNFIKKGKREIAFQVGPYDRAEPLVIDPVIKFASFLGGNGVETNGGIAVDDTTPSSPKLYVSGYTTDSTTFPEPPAVITMIGSGTSTTPPLVGEVGFIAKLDPTATGSGSLVYLTFVGGKTPFQAADGSCISAFGWLTLDKSRGAANVQPVLGGITTCSDYPVTNIINPVTAASNSDFASVATRLSVSGNSVDKAALLGGNNLVSGGFVSVNSSGDVLLSGSTSATNLPFLNAYVSSFNDGVAGGFGDCFVVRLNRADLTSNYLTYLNVGQNSTNSNAPGCGAFEDSSGDILAGGNTPSSTVFNLGAGGTNLANGFQTTSQGSVNTFLMKLNPSLIGVNQLVFGSYFGGGGKTRAANGSFDLGNGVVAVVGQTDSETTGGNAPDIPLKNAYQSMNLGAGAGQGRTGFLLLVNTSQTGANSLLSSTYFGGNSGFDDVDAVTYDAGDPTSYRIVIGGATASANFPTLNSLQPFVSTVYGFVSVLKVPLPSQSFNDSLYFSTLIGSGVDETVNGQIVEFEQVNGVAVDANHTIYASGLAVSSNFFGNTNPATTVNGFQPSCTSCGGALPEYDTAIFSIETGGSATVSSITVSPANPSIAKGSAQQFTALGFFNDGTVQDITATATWTSSDITIATINTAPTANPGLATGVKAGGPVTITAMSGNISGNTSLTVSANVTVNVGILNNNTSGGTVVDNSAPPLINCTTNGTGTESGTCSASYAVGSVVTFTETPGAGAAFNGWSGPCQAGTGGATATCTVTVTNPIGAIDAAYTNGPGIDTLTLALPSNLAASTGNGLVGSGVPSSGISCEFKGTNPPTPNPLGGTCSNATLKSGTITELIPEPDDNSTFGGWAGTCPNQQGNNCFVTMSQALITVTPVFTIIPVTVSVTVTGNGSVVDNSTPLKINCTNTNGTVTGPCSAVYNSGTSVTLTEMPGTGYTLTSFGNCGTATTCTLNLTAANNPVNVPTTFTINSYLLDVSTTGGSSTGTVTSNANNLGGKIGCGPNNQPPCGLEEQFAWPVVLTETPTANNTFTGWSSPGVAGFTLPASCTTGAPVTCSFSMPVTPAGGLTVTAAFAAPAQPSIVTVSIQGNGSVTSTSNPTIANEINCAFPGPPSVCQASFAGGTQVNLIPAPVAGQTTFSGWTAGPCGDTSANPCTFTTVAGTPVNATASFSVVTGPTLQSIVVTPANAVIPNTGTEQFTATGKYSDGSTQNLTTTVTWSGSNPNVATISNTAGSQGLLTGQAGLNGAVVVTATLGNINGSTSIVVGQVIVADFGGDYTYTTGYDDKQRTDGTSKPLVVTLTNTSTVQTITFSTVTADNPAYTVSMNCTSLAPGQSCTVPITYKTTITCENQLANITVNDNDPGGNLIFVVNGYGADTSMQVDDLSDPTLTAQALAQSLVGPGVTISNVTYTGSARAAGNFTTTSNILGFTSGVVLSTGSVHNVMGPNCVNSATTATNDQGDTGISVDNVQPGDSDLTTLVGTNTNDAAVLEFDFVPTSPTISFQYVFTSDEYNEFVGQFNDGFGFYVNGTNVALIPGTTDPVSINNVNDGNPVGTNPTNPQYYHNNEFAASSAPYDIEMNGLTVVLTAQATVTPNQANHIKLAIADASDHLYDSNVFIATGSLTSSAVSLNPTALAFGNQTIGVVSAGQTVTLTNNGTTAVNISTIAATPPFNQTNACPAQLAPKGQTGASCTITVTVTPSSATTFTGSLTVTDNSPSAGSQQSIPLSATGSGAATVTQFMVSAPATVTSGTSFNFTVTALDAAGQTVTTYSGTVQFSSSDGSAVLPAPSKLTNGVGTFSATLFPAGAQKITATDLTNEITGSATVTVIVLKSIAVTPAAPSIQIGQQQQFTATGTFSDGSTKDLTSSVTWNSENGTVASIVSAPGQANNGLATALGAGTTIITAASTTVEVSGSTQLTVTNAPFVLTIVPPAGGQPAGGPTIPPGGTLTFGINLTSQPGFSGTVTLSCVTDTPSITCQPAPSTIKLISATQVAIVLSTYCTADTAPLGRNPGGPAGGIGLLLAAMIMAGVTFVYRRRPRWALTFAVMTVIALGSSACSTPIASPSGAATLPGRHFVILTASTQVNGKTVSASTPEIPFVVQ